MAALSIFPATAAAANVLLWKENTNKFENSTALLKEEKAAKTIRPWFGIEFRFAQQDNNMNALLEMTSVLFELLPANPTESNADVQEVAACMIMGMPVHGHLRQMLAWAQELRTEQVPLVAAKEHQIQQLEEDHFADMVKYAKNRLEWNSRRPANWNTIENAVLREINANHTEDFGAVSSVWDSRFRYPAPAYEGTSFQESLQTEAIQTEGDYFERILSRYAGKPRLLAMVHPYFEVYRDLKQCHLDVGVRQNYLKGLQDDLDRRFDETKALKVANLQMDTLLNSLLIPRV